jgi:hypothetical protein
MGNEFRSGVRRNDSRYDRPAHLLAGGINNDIVAHTATVRNVWDVLIGANKSASLVLTNTQPEEKPRPCAAVCRRHNGLAL